MHKSTAMRQGALPGDVPLIGHDCGLCPVPHACNCTPSTLGRGRDAIARRCDWCGAPAGEACRRLASRPRPIRLEGIHPSRLEAVAA